MPNLTLKLNFFLINWCIKFDNLFEFAMVIVRGSVPYVYNASQFWSSTSTSVLSKRLMKGALNGQFDGKE